MYVVKVKVREKSLCLTKHRATKTYWGSGGIASRSCRFTPEKAPV